MTDPRVIKYIDQMCVKNGDIEVKNIRADGQYTLVVPVFNGELGVEQTATLDMEFEFDGEEATLLNFPKYLLTGEDYASITESIEEVMMQAQEFIHLGDKYGFKVIEQGGKLHLCAKNTDNKWTQWITYDSQRDCVSYRGNTDHLNIWLYDTRKDFTPEKCLSFVDELNQIFLTGEHKIAVKDLIDPEDWQEIAQVRDAFEDKRYVGSMAAPLADQIQSASARTGDYASIPVDKSKCLDPEL